LQYSLQGELAEGVVGIADMCDAHLCVRRVDLAVSFARAPHLSYRDR